MFFLKEVVYLNVGILYEVETMEENVIKKNKYEVNLFIRIRLDNIIGDITYTNKSINSLYFILTTPFIT